MIARARFRNADRPIMIVLLPGLLYLLPKPAPSATGIRRPDVPAG